MTVERGYTAAELMTVLLAREINDGDTVFFGVASHMPALAALLARSLHAPGCTILNIPGGTGFNGGDLNRYSSASSDLLRGAVNYFPLTEVFDLSMRGGLDVAFLSGIQFDFCGNVNASFIGSYKKPKLRAPGGAGSAVLIPTVKKAVIWRTKHDKRTFVEQVDFVTTRGNIGAVVTPLCVFGFNGHNLYPRSIHEGVSADEVRDGTAFPVDTDVPITEPPTAKELNMLRAIDEKGLRELEFTP